MRKVWVQVLYRKTVPVEVPDDYVASTDFTEEMWEQIDSYADTEPYDWEVVSG